MFPSSSFDATQSILVAKPNTSNGVALNINIVAQLFVPQAFAEHRHGVAAIPLRRPPPGPGGQWTLAHSTGRRDVPSPAGYWQEWARCRFLRKPRHIDLSEC
eukprot:8990654-Alexandrium_andersonii.AAC.1